MTLQNDDFNKLSYYTLGHYDIPYFIHQHCVDAFQAQTADNNTKPIALVFSLIGLYLFVEKGWTGRQIQNAHMTLAQYKKIWPQLPLPRERGIINVTDVLNAAAGPERDRMIKEWCSSVWTAYRDWRTTIATFANAELGSNPT